MPVFRCHSTIVRSSRLSIPLAGRLLVVVTAVWLASLAQSANAAVMLPTDVTASDLVAPLSSNSGAAAPADSQDKSDSVPVPDLSDLASPPGDAAGTGAGPGSTAPSGGNSVALTSLVASFTLDDLRVSLVGERAVHLPSPPPSGILRPPRA